VERLPLRTVLVPPELGSSGLTFVDRLLLLDIVLIAALVFWQYGNVVRGRKGESRDL
jgi:hypothetical protein